MAKVNLANNAFLTGALESDFEFRNEFMQEQFFQSRIIVKRISDNLDVIPIVVSKELLNGLDIKAGQKIYVQGQFRSFRGIRINGERHLELFLFVLDIKKIPESTLADTNTIHMYGRIANPTMFKEQKSGKKVTDMMILVPRNYNHFDYIPCIAWGSMAYYSRDLKVGDFIKLKGRIQSRTYKKQISDFLYEEKQAYEISIFNIEKVEKVE